MPLHSRSSRAARRTRRRRRLAGVVVFLAGLTGAPAVLAQTSGLPDYPTESDILAHVPGATTSLAAGFFNPAAWGLHRGGMFLSWDDSLSNAAPQARTHVLKVPLLAFGSRRLEYHLADGTSPRLTDYTLGLSGGMGSGAAGFSYSWATNQKGENGPAYPRHERLAVGLIVRPTNTLSIGSAFTRDLDVSDNTWQADVGARPFGPRVTVFADALTRKGESLGDVHLGYGAEVIPLRGLTLSGRARDDGSFSLSASVTLTRGVRFSARPHYDADGNHAGNTFAIELAPSGPAIGSNFGVHGRRVPEIALRGSVAYQRYQFFDDRRTLLSLQERIAEAATDAGVAGLVLNLSDMHMSPEVMWEVRSQLAAFRATGRTVTVYADDLTMFTYTFATVADTIWLDPQADLDLRGLAAGRTFYKNALDKIGVGFDELRFFRYKSAVESFSRTTLSEADREQRRDLVNDWYDEIARLVTAGRGLTSREWDAIIDTKGFLRADEAVDARLADRIGSWDDALHAARAAARSGPRREGALVDVRGNREWDDLAWGSYPRIALLYAIGPCSMDSGIRGRVLSRRIKAAREDRSVKAVVLRADSPGGDPLPSDLVARELRLTSRVKPVIVSQGQVAGSGGYWISMDGDAILSSPFSITGSIGVISAWIWDKELGTKLGLTYDGVSRGAHADMDQGIRLPLFNETIPRRPLTSEERERMRHEIVAMYDDFVGAVARARGLSPARVDSIGQGHFYSGTRALRLGLVDGIGTMWDALRLAKAKAGFAPDAPVVIAEGPSRGLINPAIFQPFRFGARAADQPSAPLSAAPDAPSPVREALEGVSLTDRLFLAHMVRAGGRAQAMTAPLLVNGLELW